ncbi:MAG: helix-hairpin-helix domain-containing protein [Candidatus Thorarchaeota archaeon]
MRYGQGIFIGALLPGIIFIGSIFPKIAGQGVTDPQVLASIWSLYILWFFISLCIAIFPVIVVYANRRDIFREFIIFEAGGFALFSPFWLFLATDLSGDSWTDIIFNGIENGLLAPGPGGTLIGIDISNIFMVPLLIAMVITGLVMLRPSFIAEHGGAPVKKPSKAPDEPAAGGPPGAPAPGGPPGAPATTVTEDPLEQELPGVKPPAADETSKVELRSLLMELGIPDPTITAIFNAGYANVTDIVATSAEQLALTTGLDKATAENLHMAVQKKVWFGGI